MQQVTKNFRILLLGNKSSPINKIFQDKFNKDFKQKYGPNIIYENYQNLEEFQKQSTLNQQKQYDMISLAEFGQQQIELLLHVYKQQPQNIKIIHGFLVGVDKFLPILQENKVKENVIIANAKGAFSPSLGEFVVFSCLYHAKLTQTFTQAQKQKKWIRVPVNMVTGKTIGICGLGSIGTVVGQYCKNMGLNVIALKNNPTDLNDQQIKITDKVYGFDQFDQLLKESDYVVNVLPLTAKTSKIFDYKAFQTMKNTGIFINIGRGQSVVENDLHKAIIDKQIAGATLDVFDVEPLNENSNLWDLENVYISQHCADYTNDFWELTYDVFKNNLQNYLEGKQMENVVDRQKGY